MNSENFLDCLGAFVSVIVVLGAVVFAILYPKFEAEAYTRLTGKKVSYWDAVWLDLRIQEQVR